MNKQIQVKVTMNQFGNWKGRVTGDRFKTELGCSKFDAAYWAANKLEQLPGSILHADSDIDMEYMNRINVPTLSVSLNK